MSVISSFQQLNTTEASEIIFSTLNRSIGQQRFQDNELIKQNKIIKKMSIMQKLQTKDDTIMSNIKSVLDLQFRNITMYFFENADDKQIDMVSTKLTSFMLNMQNEHSKHLLYIDDFTIFCSLSKFDIHYLSYVFKHGFIFLVSNSTDALRMQQQMQSMILLNLTTHVQQTRDQFLSQRKTKVLDAKKFNQFYDNYSNTYNKLFILMFSSINQFQLFELFVENNTKVKYIQCLTYELNLLKSRFDTNKPRFLSSCILPLLNIQVDCKNKNFDVNTIFGFEKLIDLYFDDRKGVNLSEYSNDDGMKFIFDVITNIFINIHENKQIVKLPRQCYPILLIWYKTKKNEIKDKLFSFLPAVYQIHSDISTVCDEIAIAKIFNIQSLDTMSQKRKKYVDAQAYNKFVVKNSITFNDEDEIIKQLGDKTYGRLQQKHFGADYTDKELSSVYTISTTVVKTTTSVVTDKFPTQNETDDSSDEDQIEKIKTVTSIDVDLSDSDSDSDDQNGLIALLRKKKLTKLKENVKSKASSSSSSTSTLLVKDKKQSLSDSEDDEDKEKDKLSDRSTTPSEDEEEEEKDNFCADENALENFIDAKDKIKDDVLPESDNIDNFVSNFNKNEFVIKGKVNHDGSCFYGSVALHINENVHVMMQNLKDKLKDKIFLKQVDDLLEENKCITRLSGEIEPVLKTLTPNANGTYNFADNLAFPTVSELIQRNVVVICGNDMFLDQSNRYNENLFILTDGQIAFDPIENVDVTKFRKLNWDGMEVEIEDEYTTMDESESDEVPDIKEIEEVSISAEISDNKSDDHAEETITDDVDSNVITETIQSSSESESEDNDDIHPTLQAAKMLEQCQTKDQEKSSDTAIDIVTKITSDNKMLAIQLCNVETQRDEAYSQMQLMTCKINDVEHSIEGMRKTIDDLHKKLFALDDAHKKLKKDNSDSIELFEKKMKSLLSENDLLSDENKSLKKDNEILYESNQEMVGVILTKDKIISAQDKRIIDKDNFVQKIKQEKYDIINEKNEIFIKYEKVMNEKNDIMTDNENLFSQNEELKQEVETFKNVLQDKENLKNELDIANERIKQITSDNLTCNELVIQLEKKDIKINELRELNIKLKEQITSKDKKIISSEEEKKGAEARAHDLEKQNELISKNVTAEKLIYKKPEPIEKFNQYVGPMYDHIITQVKLYNEKENGTITLRDYYMACDSSLIFGKDVDENCVIFYSNHFNAILPDGKQNYVLVNRRCPCKGHKTVDEWVSLRYVIDERYQIALTTSYVCGCMVKPASIDDLLSFQTNYNIYRHAVSALLNKYTH